MACNHRRALELAEGGSWDEAHELVQPYSDRLSCLIHAYLHRVEGDLGNASYWYRRAGEEASRAKLAEELERLRALAESGANGFAT